MHGDLDAVVPLRNSELMEQALRRVGVPVKLLRIPGAGHGPDFPAIDPPDYLTAMVRWFAEHLRTGEGQLSPEMPTELARPRRA